jgi:GNAT superfamily N-acetyltransferase
VAISYRARGNCGFVVEIHQEPATVLARYASVSVRFAASSVLDVAEESGRFTLTERGLEHAFIKDYDNIPGNEPATWARRFDVSSWGVFSALRDGQLVGAAALGPTDKLLSHDGDATDAAALWDLRVSPEARRGGVGKALFQAAEQWTSGETNKFGRVGQAPTVTPRTPTGEEALGVWTRHP